jgi:hypothetical protein
MADGSTVTLNGRAPFGGVDGLMIFAHVDGDPTNRGASEGLQEGLVCATGGQPSEPGLAGERRTVRAAGRRARPARRVQRQP